MPQQYSESKAVKKLLKLIKRDGLRTKSSGTLNSLVYTFLICNSYFFWKVPVCEHINITV